MTTAELEEEVVALPSEEREYLRTAAKQNLYVLCKGVLNYPDVNPGTHGAFIRFITDHSAKRKLGLMPRAHLKSTVGTIGDSIRMAIADPEETRILIAAETAKLSEKFLREIKNHFESNKLLRSLYPEIVPDKFSGPGVNWTNNQATIKRESPNKDPTWSATGVGGAIIGAHFTHIKCDDLIGFEAGRSPAKMSEAIDWVNNIESLLTNQHIDTIHWYGTRWSRGDLYRHIMQAYGSELSVFLREAIEDGKIIFPQLHTWEEYERIQRIEPRVWYAQYRNNPIASGQTDFPAHDLRTFKFSPDGMYVIARGDDGKEIRWHLDQLDRVLTADPNGGSLTAENLAAVVVSGMSPDDEVFTLESWSDRVTSSAFVDKIFSSAKRWRVRAVGIEKAGQQNTQHYFEKKKEQEDLWVQVVPLSHKSKNKDDRIRGSLEPIIRSRQLFTLVSQQILRGQISAFPDTLIKDELDALAYGPDLWRRPWRNEDVVKHRRNLDLILRRRNSVTGY